MSITLITDGALPRPARCIACGYGGTDRWFIKFQSFIPKLGQVLLCVAKYPGDDQTGCFNEAADKFPVGFTSRAALDAVLDANNQLRTDNANLERAATRFRNNFDDIVSAFLADLKTERSVPPYFAGLTEPIGTDGAGTAVEEFDGKRADIAGGEAVGDVSVEGSDSVSSSAFDRLRSI